LGNKRQNILPVRMPIHTKCLRATHSISVLVQQLQC